MQTFINPTTPFFDEHGNIIPCARVSFVSVDTDSEYIDIYDKDGTTLANPLILASDGTFNANEVPYFDDDQTFKVIVEKPTGVTPVVSNDEVINASQLYTLVREFVVKAHDNESLVVNASVVYGIAAVRSAAKSLGSVVCVGYDDADDGCPARVFTWVTSADSTADNAFNVLRNPNDTSGYWLMSEPYDCIDVRMGGVFQNEGASITSAKLTNLINKVGTLCNTKTLYFPAGNYYVSYSHSFNSAIIEKGVNFLPDTTANTTLTFVHLENRGGRFCALSNANDAKRVLPRVSGELRTSWLNGSVNEFLTDGVVNACETIVFDTIGTNGSTAVTIRNKRIVVKCSIPNTITFVNCVEVNYTDGSIQVNSGMNKSSISSSTITNVQNGHWSKMDGGDIECSDCVKGANASFSDGVSCASLTTDSVQTGLINVSNPAVVGAHSWMGTSSMGVSKSGVEILGVYEDYTNMNSAAVNIVNKLNVGGIVCESFSVEYPSSDSNVVYLNNMFKDAPAGTIIRVKNSTSVTTDALKDLVIFYALNNSKSRSISAAYGELTSATVALGECKQFISMGKVTFVYGDTSSSRVTMTETIWAVL